MRSGGNGGVEKRWNVLKVRCGFSPKLKQKYVQL